MINASGYQQGQATPECHTDDAGQDRSAAAQAPAAPWIESRVIVTAAIAQIADDGPTSRTAAMAGDPPITNEAADASAA